MGFFGRLSVTVCCGVGLGVVTLLVGCAAAPERTAEPRTVNGTLALAWAVIDSYDTFGEPMSGGLLPLYTTDVVLSDPKSLEGKTLRVVGQVAEVCQAKGCWLNLAGPDGQRLFVKFVCPIEGRLIPQEAVGKTALVEGQIVVEIISEAEAQHILAEAGKTAAEIDKVQGEQVRVRVMSPAARIAK